MTSQQRAMRRHNLRQRIAGLERHIAALEVERQRQATVVDDSDYGWHRRRYLPTALAKARASLARCSAELESIGYERRRLAA